MDDDGDAGDGLVQGASGVIEILRYYTSTFCFLQTVCQTLPHSARWVLAYLAGPYAVPLGLMLIVLTGWFKGGVASERKANQRALLRAVVALAVAWGIAAVIGLAWRAAERISLWAPSAVGWDCWRGLPSACPAAAVGFALGAVLWRRDWHRGLLACLLTGMWAAAQVSCGVRYPVDVVVGTIIGVVTGWHLGGLKWLDRVTDAGIRLARRLTLA